MSHNIERTLQFFVTMRSAPGVDKYGPPVEVASRVITDEEFRIANDIGIDIGAVAMREVFTRSAQKLSARLKEFGIVSPPVNPTPADIEAAGDYLQLFHSWEVRAVATIGANLRIEETASLDTNYLLRTPAAETTKHVKSLWLALLTKISDRANQLEHELSDQLDKEIEKQPNWRVRIEMVPKPAEGKPAYLSRINHSTRLLVSDVAAALNVGEDRVAELMLEAFEAASTTEHNFLVANNIEPLSSEQPTAEDFAAFAHVADHWLVTLELSYPGAFSSPLMTSRQIPLNVVNDDDGSRIEKAYLDMRDELSRRSSFILGASASDFLAGVFLPLSQELSRRRKLADDRPQQGQGLVEVSPGIFAGELSMKTLEQLAANEG